MAPFRRPLLQSADFGETRTGRVPNPPGANPLVAERAFPTSDYWGCTGVARCEEEMTGIRRDFQSAADRLSHKIAKTSKGPLSATRGLAPGGLGTRQSKILGFLEFIFCCWRGFGTLWVGGSRRSANRGLPLPLGRGVCETKSKKGRARDRKPFIHGDEIITF